VAADSQIIISGRFSRKEARKQSNAFASLPIGLFASLHEIIGESAAIIVCL